jgi:hypothetical protein
MTNNLENQTNEQEKHPSLAIANKSPVSFAYKNLLKRPPHVLASEAELTSYKEMFDLFFDVEIVFGISLNHNHPSGVFVGVLYVKDAPVERSEAFLIHEAKKDPKMVNQLIDRLAPITLGAHEDIISCVLAYMIELQKRRDYKVLDEEVLDELLSSTLGTNSALKRFQSLEQAMIAEPEYFASMQLQYYDANKHHGILLDTPQLKRKYGDHAVGVHRELLINLFCGGEDDSVNRQANNPTLNLILDGWKKANKLIKRTEEKRLNEKITGLNENNKFDRFYVVKSEKLYKAWDEYMKEEGLENGNR